MHVEDEKNYSSKVHSRIDHSCLMFGYECVSTILKGSRLEEEGCKTTLENPVFKKPRKS